MDISVIFSTFKRPATLSSTLKSFVSLKSQNIKWELIIVDNADDAETAKVVEEYLKYIPIKFLVEKKAGKNHALNRALPEAKGSLFVFTDDDVIVDSNWLIELWEGANRWSEHSIFGGRIVAKWPYSEPFWGEDHPLNQGLFALHCPSFKEKIYSEGDFLPYGPNMAIRRKIFDKGYKYNSDIGPDGSLIYVMGSETELLKRLKADGHIPVFLPKARVQHQIRPDQLTQTGLNRRNFRIGLSDSQSGAEKSNKLFSCPRYLWKQLILNELKFLGALILNRRLKTFEYKCAVWRTRGKIYGFRSKNMNKSSLLQTFLSGRI